RPQPGLVVADPLHRGSRIRGVLSQTGEQRRWRFGDLKGLRLASQLLQHVPELEQRVVAGSGKRGVTGGPDRSDAEAKDALFGAADAVVALAPVLEALPGALVEQHVA